MGESRRTGSWHGGRHYGSDEQLTAALDKTSTDAAGLARFGTAAGTDEAAAGEVKYADRVTISKTQKAYAASAAQGLSERGIPMHPLDGQKVLRLKVNFHISKYSKRTR